MNVPAQLARFLTDRANEGWSGTITLNCKDGHIVAYEVTEKHRIASGDPREPASNNAGGSHGGRAP